MTFNTSRKWTDEEDRKLLELHDARRSILSIAAALKRTKGAVHARLSILRAEVREKETAPG